MKIPASVLSKLKTPEASGKGYKDQRLEVSEKEYDACEMGATGEKEGLTVKVTQRSFQKQNAKAEAVITVAFQSK